MTNQEQKRMNLESNMTSGPLRGLRVTKTKTPEPNFADKWRARFRRRRRMHDPMLVLNMSEFNFADGWSRTFNPLKVHENGTDAARAR